jgi:hypothetical protein
LRVVAVKLKSNFNKLIVIGSLIALDDEHLFKGVTELVAILIVLHSHVLQTLVVDSLLMKLFYIVVQTFLGLH